MILWSTTTTSNSLKKSMPSKPSIFCPKLSRNRSCPSPRPVISPRMWASFRVTLAKVPVPRIQIPLVEITLFNVYGPHINEFRTYDRAIDAVSTIRTVGFPLTSTFTRTNPKEPLFERDFSSSKTE